MPDMQTTQAAESVHEDPVFRELLRWVDRTPVPRSRPVASPSDEAAGLVILDLSLRLEHVSRVTDGLRIIDQSHVQRTITLDVDLRGLTREQREALTVRRGLTPHEAGSPEEDRPMHLWVPVSRHSRMDLSPVVVRDAADQVLPRLTQGAASRTLVAGLSRLLKSIRDSTAEDRAAPESMWLIVEALRSLVEEGPLGPQADEHLDRHGADHVADGYRSGARRFLHQIPADLRQSLDRLIEVAYSEYVLVVMLPARTTQAHLRFDAPLIPAARQATSWFRRNAPGREYTIDYRTEIARSLGSYHVTVEVAEEIYVRRYILSSAADKASVAELGRDLRRLSAALGGPNRPKVKGAPAGRDRRKQQEGQADAPANAEDRRIRVMGRRGDGSDRRSGLIDRRGPSGDRRAQGPGDRRSDGRAADRRAGDGDRRLTAQARSADAGNGPRRGSVGRRGPHADRRRHRQDRRASAEDLTLWLEFESIVSKLAHLGRRRNLERRRYRSYIEQQELGHPVMDEAQPAPTRVGDAAIMRALSEGEVNLLLLDQLADLYAKRPLHESMSGLRLVDFREGLPRIADWLRDARLGEDVIVENDPRENGAHAQWRHKPLPFGSPGLEPIPARVFLTLADEKPALADSVRNMLFGLIAVTLGLFLLLRRVGTGEDGPDTQTDALVAVLLLVPGILLSRLDIPSTNSVLGQLRAASRKVAYSSVVLTSGLAVAVSTGWAVGGRLWAFVFVLVALVACLCFSLVEGRRRATRRNRGIPDAADVPWWLRRPDGGPDEASRRRELTADVVFDAIDGRQPRDGRRTLAAAVRATVPAAWRRLRQAMRRPGKAGHAAADASGAARAQEGANDALAVTLAGRRALRGADLARAAARAVTARRSGVLLTVVHSLGPPEDGSGVDGAEGDESSRVPSKAGRSAPPEAMDELLDELACLADDLYVSAVGRPSELGAPEAPVVTGQVRTSSGISYTVSTPVGPTLLPTPVAAVDFLFAVHDDRDVAMWLLHLLLFDTASRCTGRGGRAAAKVGHVLVKDVRFPETHTGLGIHEAAAAMSEQPRQMLRVSVALPETSSADSGDDATGAAPPARRTEPARPPDAQDARRLELTQYLAGLCVDARTDLYASDDSLPSGRTWRAVVPPRPGPASVLDPGGGQEGEGPVPKPADAVSAGGAQEALLVTIAGSTVGYDIKAAVNLCQRVLASPPNVKILSVSVARLLEQPVISLVLRRADVPADELSPAMAEPDFVPADRSGCLQALTDFLGDAHEPSGLAAAFEEAAEGRALMVTPVRADGPAAGARTAEPSAPARPLWMQWSWPGPAGTSVAREPSALVQRLLGQEGADVRLVQHRVRRDRDGRVKGSAQLQVRWLTGEADFRRRLHAIERTVRRMVAETHRSPHEVLFRLARDEGWLSGE